MDYHGAADKSKEPSAKQEKKVEKVVTEPVIIQKKGLGRKVKELFIEADLKGASHYVISMVLIPALRNLIVETSTKGIERVMYGDAATRYRGYGPGPRITYNSPIHRQSAPYSPLGMGGRHAPPVQNGPRSGRQSRDDVIVSSRAEGELVLERLNDIIETYEVANWADLNELLGLPTTHTDNKWGWTYVGDAAIRQVREGYLIDLPPAEPIS